MRGRKTPPSQAADWAARKTEDGASGGPPVLQVFRSLEVQDALTVRIGSDTLALLVPLLLGGCSVRVVTVERFGTLTPDKMDDRGSIYGGDAWQLRFVTQSVDRFFEVELPNLCHVLNNIDVRQIYELHLYGDSNGLYDVRVYISFEENPPTDEQIDNLKLAVSEVDAPEYIEDMMDHRIVRFLRHATKRDKKRFAAALEKETKHAPGQD